MTGLKAAYSICMQDLVRGCLTQSRVALGHFTLESTPVGVRITLGSYGGLLPNAFILRNSIGL